MAHTAIFDFDTAFVADAAAMADALWRVGDEEATSLALLPAGALGALLDEARDLPYRPAKP
ncbi:MAG: hypothetical protein IMF05_08485, partial [Proteobacteria bacterium]|nr:hypothetical protein [Pseudomonadota bacterium]